MKKRILKRIGCSLVILSSLLMGTACLNPSNAQDVLFYKSTVHVGMGDSHDYDYPVTFDFENQKYLMERDSQSRLHLKSADRKTDYLSFIPYEKDVEYEDYDVKKIYTSNPNLQFLEIIASVGAHGKTAGYWLIGRYNNKWVTFVSYDSLQSMGLPDWARITSEINPDRSGKMILNVNKDEDYPDYMQIELYWSNKSNWIGMKRIR